MKSEGAEAHAPRRPAVSIPGRRDFRGESSEMRRAPHGDGDGSSRRKHLCATHSGVKTREAKTVRREAGEPTPSSETVRPSGQRIVRTSWTPQHIHCAGLGDTWRGLRPPTANALLRLAWSLHPVRPRSGPSAPLTSLSEQARAVSALGPKRG